MKKLLLFTLLSLCLALIPRVTYAHVLVTDTTKTRGIIVHVNPNDDPIAGQPSQLFFDIQDPALLGDTAARLSVASDDVTETIHLITGRSSLSATYTFPAQGTYDFTLTLTSHDKPYVFHFSQPVTHGTLAAAPQRRSHSFAKATLAISTGLLAITLIVAFNRRRGIAAQSTF